MKWQLDERSIYNREGLRELGYYRSGAWMDLEHLNWVLKEFKQRVIKEIKQGQTEFTCYMTMKRRSEAEFNLIGEWNGNQFTAQKLTIEYLAEPIEFETDCDMISFSL